MPAIARLTRYRVKLVDASVSRLPRAKRVNAAIRTSRAGFRASRIANTGAPTRNMKLNTVMPWAAPTMDVPKEALSPGSRPATT